MIKRRSLAGELHPLLPSVGIFTRRQLIFQIVYYLNHFFFLLNLPFKIRFMKLSLPMIVGPASYPVFLSDSCRKGKFSRSSIKILVGLTLFVLPVTLLVAVIVSSPVLEDVLF